MKQRPRQDIAGHVESPGNMPVAASGPRQNGRRPIPRKSMLVVDDESSVAAVVVEVFSQDGYTVDVASDGQEALEKLRQQTFDVIMCDIRMPKMDGLAFYRLIAQQEPRLLSRLIFLTGDTLNPTTQAVLHQVGVPVVEKPFDLGKLREVVGRVLRVSERP